MVRWTGPELTQTNCTNGATGQFREWGRPLARPDSCLLKDTSYSKAFFVVQHQTYPGDGLDILSNKTLLSGFYYRRVYVGYWRRYQGSGL